MIFDGSCRWSIMVVLQLSSISGGLLIPTRCNTSPYVKALPHMHGDAYPHQTQKFTLLSISPVSPLTISNDDLRCVAPKNWYLLSGDYRPWPQRPMCVDGKSNESIKTKTFCLFADQSFNNGRGIVAFTTPQVAKQIAARSGSRSRTDILNKGVDCSMDRPKYEVRELPGKGLGITANQTLTQGDRIEQESSPWVFNHAATIYLDNEDRIPMQWHGIYMLPKQTRDELLALDKYYTGDEIDGLMRTNSFGTQYDKDVHWTIFTRIARFNHDCRPNADYFFDSQTMTQYVHAVTEIAAGEEINIAYIDTEEVYAKRQTTLMQHWNFSCRCRLCGKSTDQIASSDERLQMITQLQDELHDWTQFGLEHTKRAEELVTLYEAERLWTSPIGYQAAAYAYSVQGDAKMGAMFAEKALKVVKGLDEVSHDWIRDLEELINSPTTHLSWSYKSQNATK